MASPNLGAAPSIMFTFDDVIGPDRLSDRATDQLRTLIITLQLPPGALLDEAVLSQHLNCGRTPIREAIQRLTQERLVTILPRRAAAVSAVSVTDLQQLYEARSYLEPAIAGLAAKRATPAQLQQIEASLMSPDSDGPEHTALDIVRADFAYHYLLARAADNDYFADCIRRILGPAMRLTFLAHKHGQPSQNSREEHTSILRAVAARDSDAADNAMRHHINMAKERTLHRL